MPVNITDVDAFTDPITAPAGADAANAASVVDVAQKLANRTRYLANLIGEASGSAEWAYPSPRARTILVGPRAGRGGSGWTFALIDRARCSSNSHNLFIDISDHLPSGAVLTDVRALVKPGFGRGTGDRMELSLWRSAVGAAFGTPGDPAETQVGTTDEDDGSNSYQVLSVGTISETVDRDANVLVAWVHAGNTAGTGGQEDDFLGLELSFTDPGPRNF